MISLTVPEIRRLLQALGDDPTRFGFRLAWSHWRRHHQAEARRGHVARRAQRRAGDASALAQEPGAALMVSAAGPHTLCADLSADEWARILPLLPPEKPARGRPAHAHRPLVAAMLWVERTGASWRQIPEQAGPWHRVYNRYRLWRRSGLWARIVTAVAPAPLNTAPQGVAHAPPDARIAA